MDNKIKNGLVLAGLILAVIPNTTWLGGWVDYVLLEAAKDDHIWSSFVRFLIVVGGLLWAYELIAEIKNKYGKHKQN